MSLSHSELGKKSNYQNKYDPSLLFPIPRIIKRAEIEIDDTNLPFYGVDVWNHYEISWLNPHGKPMVAIGELIYSCSSPNIIESKSMKLYFNSFNNTIFDTPSKVSQCVIRDLTKAVGDKVTFTLTTLPLEAPIVRTIHIGFNNAICLDSLDIKCDTYLPNPNYLNNVIASTTNNIQSQVQETLYSNLLKSNCLITHQPDWGSIYIEYNGATIDHCGLLKYIVSLRNHNEFHEQCVERIFKDIMTQCTPKELTVYARYTRRGGIDINPYRTTNANYMAINQRLIRQ